MESRPSLGMRPFIALITDYGVKDPYVAQIKAVILRYRDDTVIIDVTHEVEAFNELEAAFLLKTYVGHMPPGTIHLCVIDPGVGAGRRGIILSTRRGDIFIGPDTGFMVPAAEELRLDKAYIIDESKLPPRRSETFHGRDVFAHVAGLLVSGRSPEDIGIETENYSSISIPQPEIIGKRVEAIVMHVDRFGNLVTNLSPSMLERVGGLGDSFRVRYHSGEVSCRWVKAYGMVGVGEPLLVEGGTGYIEFSVNRGDAAKLTGLKPGDRIVIESES